MDQNRSYDEVDSWRAKEHGVTTTKSSLSRYGRPRQARALSGARMRQPIDANGREEAMLARPRHLGLAARMEPQPDRPTTHRLLEMVTALERTRLARMRAGLGSGR